MEPMSFEQAVRADLRRWGAPAADDPAVPLSELTALWRAHHAACTVTAAA